jgi:hypothetical protein
VNVQLLLIAKAPVPGWVKTRLCPPCTPPQAAAIADAALRDTIDVLSAAPAARRTAVLSGQYRLPAGWRVVAQRGRGLGSSCWPRSGWAPQQPWRCGDSGTHDLKKEPRPRPALAVRARMIARTVSRDVC